MKTLVASTTYLVCVLLALPALAAEKVPHPFVLWTRDEAGALRKKIMADAAMRDRFVETFKVQTNAYERSTLDNLFLYTMTGDAEAADAEKQALLGFINAPPEIRDMTDWRWHHVDQSDMPIRYDVLYDELTPAQRAAVGETFRTFAVFGITPEPEGGEKLKNWDHHARMASHSFCALVLQDKRLIRDIFQCPGGLRSYFDNMLDGHLPGNAAAPNHRLLGHMWLWCRGVERLGMDEMGFGYRGKHGGSMRTLLEGLLLMGDPRIEIPGGTPFYGRSAISLQFLGSASGFRIPLENHPRDIFQAPLVIGYLRNGSGGWNYWNDSKKGKFYEPYSTGSAQLHLPSVFELAHRRWPDAGFGYFLEQMKPPGADRYTPSIYWGMDPVDPKHARPPEVSSAVYPRAGLALCRSESGAAFWTSPAPYAVMQLANWSGRHAAGSSLSLHRLAAFNRPLVRHLEVSHGFREGEGWFSTGKPHNTVVVDNARAGSVPDAPVRHHFDAHVSFVGTRAVPRTALGKDEEGNMATNHIAIYPGVEMERCLALTREYLFDVFRASDDAEHTYDWMLHAVGSAEPDQPESWEPTEHLNTTLPGKIRDLPYNFTEQHGLDTRGRAWSLNAVQTATTTNLEATVMGPAWYQRRVGVRVTMLGEKGTRAFYARKPLSRKLTKEESEQLYQERYPYRLPERDKEYDAVDHQITEIKIAPLTAPKPKTSEKTPIKLVGTATEAIPGTGGVTIVAERKAPTTLFVTLHEPFEKGQWSLREFRRIRQTDTAVAVAVRGGEGSAVNDRVLVALGDAAGQPVTLAGDGESFTFTGFAYVRVAKDRVTASGGVSAMKLKVEGKPKLFLNGKETKAKVRWGAMTFGE